MNDGSEATNLTNTLLSSIRLQRHIGTRVFISTQEPSISPKLLDLCSVTIVHRFTSPDWLKCLRAHLAALDNDDGVTTKPKLMLANAFHQIVKLKVGEALLFAPSAIIDVKTVENQQSGTTKSELQRLGIEFLRVKIRDRVTADGGRSILVLGSKASPFVKAPAVTKGTVFFQDTSSTTSAFKGFGSSAPPTTSLFGTPANVSLFGANPNNQQPNSTRGAAQINSTSSSAIFGSGVLASSTTGSKPSSVPSVLSSMKSADCSNNRMTFSSTGFGAKPASESSLSGNNGVANPRENNPTSSPVKSNISPVKVDHSRGALLQANTNGNASQLMTSSTSPFVIKGSFEISTAMPPPALPSTKWGFQPIIEKDPTSNSEQYNTFQTIAFQPPYTHYSFEELRLADYGRGDKKAGSVSG